MIIYNLNFIRTCICPNETNPILVVDAYTELSFAETLEIARDIAKKLLEAREERQTPIHLNEIEDVFDYPLIVGI